jgi:transcriptional regulator with XRE-family HTH domain
MKNELFRKKLREVLNEKNLTQKQLAEKLGIAQEQVSFWVTGIRNPRYASLKKIADALDKPINFFFEKSDLEKSGGAVQWDEFDGFKREVAKDVETLKKDIEILKLQIELLKKDLLIEQNKK